MLTNAINNIINGVPFWYGMGKSGFMGAVSGAISFGIGTIATSQFGAVMSIGKAAFQAGMHGITSGIMSELQGGTFGSGFAAGAISSLISSGIESLGQTGDVGTDAKGNEFALRNNFGDGPLFKATMLAAGGLSGGISSSIVGGNFWAGVRQGLITSGLNHLAHSVANAFQEDPLKKHAGEAKHTLEEWEARYKDMSWKEIATEAGWKDGQPLGPNKEWRYIKAPDGNIMDMRHVVVVGYGYGENAGRMIEHAQNLRASTRGSAYDPQDYYSNKIGAYYYQMRHSGSWASPLRKVF